MAQLVRMPFAAELSRTGSRRLRRARPRSHRAAALGADPARRAGHPAHDPMIGQAYRQRYRCGVCRLPRRTSVPVAATASRTPMASHAIASRPVTRRPLTRDSRLSGRWARNRNGEPYGAGVHGDQLLRHQCGHFMLVNEYQAPSASATSEWTYDQRPACQPERRATARNGHTGSRPRTSCQTGRSATARNGLSR